MTKNHTSEFSSSNPSMEIKTPKSFLDRTWKYIIVFLLFVNFFCYVPESPYSLSLSFWYADFRYWSDWISDCCWFVFVWAIVSMLLTLLIPKSEKRIFLLRRSFFQKVVGLLFLYLLWSIWYTYATLPLTVIFEPIISPSANWIHKNYTVPLTHYYSTGKGWNPMLLPIICLVVLVIAFVTWRIRRYFRRDKDSKKTIIPLILLAFIPAILGAGDIKPPKKVETSKGIYDVKSKEEIFNFTTTQIRELIKMEDKRTKGSGKTPHPILVYCFEERSFKYTGGKYKDAEIKYRLHVPRKIIPSRKYPLVVHLHGIGEAGKDNTLSLAHLHSVLPLMLGEEQQDFFLLVLQCPPDNRAWTFKPEKDGNLDVVVALTDHVVQNNPIDEKRLSLFGLSSGGNGVWRWLLKYPDKFAAVVPASCSSPRDLSKLATFIETPVWTFRNNVDNKAPLESIQEAMQIINGSGGFMKLTQFEQGGHAAWRPAMDDCNCFGWMISQRRGGWFNPPPEREIYTYRSASNCFHAFFLPLMLAAGMLVFQRTKYCERLHERIAKKFYPARSAKKEEAVNDNISVDEATKVVDDNVGVEETIKAVNDNANVDDTANDFRAWTSFKGTQKIKLKLIDVKNGMARFEQLNGKIIATMVTSFCTDDQAILKSLDTQPPDDQFRIWTDTSGEKTLEAKLVRVKDDKAWLQLKTGQTGPVRIKFLSEADQKIIQQFQEQKYTATVKAIDFAPE